MNADSFSLLVSKFPSIILPFFQILANDNSIEELAANTLTGLNNLTQLSLERNRLAKFSINSIALTLDPNIRQTGI